MYRREFLKHSAIVGFALSSSGFVKASGMFQSANSRKVATILSAKSTRVGTLPILRGFAGNHADLVSPYVLLDEFGPVSMNPGADPLRVNAHPHAGVTPTTYFLSGSGHHKDSLDYDFQVGKGEFMMFSSGRGAIHMEETGKQLFDKGGIFHGFQIWLNTPAKHKMIAPSTHVFRDNQMATVQEKGLKGTIVLGELFGEKSSVETLTPAFYFHLKLEFNGRVDIPVNTEHNAFIYMISGDLELEGQRKLEDGHLALFQRGEDRIRLFSSKGAEFILLGGQPLNEPVFSYGPFVMNNEAQVRQCIVNYNSGKMGDPNKVN